jgi:protein SCO1/2
MKGTTEAISRLWLVAAFIVALVTLTGCDRREPEAKFETTDITGVDWGRDFHLVDPSGAPRSLADYRGKVVIMFFGYTNCPDECPLNLAKMAQAVDRLGPDGQRVQGLFVTVDPARDTPAVLAKYVPAFHPAFVGLSADAATIEATAKDFKIYFAAEKPDDAGRYMVAHNGAIFVFDSDGRLRLLMHNTTPIDAMVHDLKLLLREAPRRA